MSSRLCISLLWLAGAVTTTAADLPAITPLKEAPPVIDGRLNDGEWKEALSLGKFLDDMGHPVTPATEVWITSDDRYLYVAFRCDEPKMTGVHTETIGDQRDAPVWFDDSIDFFIDPGNTGKSVFRVAVNSEGTFFDGEGSEDHDYPAWDSGAQVRTSRHDQHWEVEMAIPLGAFRHQPVMGEVMAVSAGRVRFAGGAREHFGLAGRHFRPFKRFQKLLWQGPAKIEEVALVSDYRGPFYHMLPSEWSFELTNSGAQPVTLEVSFPEDKGASSTIELPPGTQPLLLPIGAGEVERKSKIKVSFNGRALYESAYEPHQSEVVNRVYQAEHPRFTELIEPASNALSKEGTILWAHDVNGPPDLLSFSQKTGAPFSQDQVYQQLGEEGAILIVQSATTRGTRGLELARKHGVRYLVILSEREAAKRGAMMTEAKRPWFFDPIAQQAYFEDLKATLDVAKQDEVIWGVFLGDETWTKILRDLFWYIKQGDEAFPQLKEIDARVKAEFGHGQFGLPTAPDDSNPYRWIATYRWLSSELIKMQRKVKEIVRAECPRLRIVAWDNQSGHLPYEIARWKGDFDVMTGQIYPSLNPARDLVGFSVSLYRDLAGIPELWPCVHIEHFAANFTPREAIGLLNQAFIGGATGLHLYMSDTKGRRAGFGAFPTDRYGAPERWSAVAEVMGRLKNAPFRVHRASPDTAIFYSNPSYQGQGGERPKSAEVEWIYNILGPRLQGSIRFVDEIVLEREPKLLDSHKVVYIPYAPIVDDAEFQQIDAYVRQGGTLVICDPDAFRNRSDGSERDLSAFYASVEKTPHAPPQGEAMRYRLGAGQILRFSANPLLVPSVGTSASWIDWFRITQEQSGAATALPLWQFSFPQGSAYVYERPEGECLTGNYFQWILSEGRAVANRNRPGSYTLSHAISGEPADTPIPFSEGKLTDRLRSLSDPTNRPVKDYVLQWKTDQPLEITFSFDAEVKPYLLRLITRGTLPAGSLEVAISDKDWKRVAAWEESNTEPAADIVLRAIELETLGSQRARLRFESTAEAKPFTLAELDLWEKP